MNKEYVKVKDAPGFVRHNSAVISVDNNALEAYKLKRQTQQETKSAINEIPVIKQELSEIKNLLAQLLNKRI